ncbi:hypothetical protein BGZ65_006029 [Modicella reniformis]|uniref:OTU domain-containing protein n=1 Tax=Modicella reniformis TaxID=1440133 RepID=A0A9P6IQ16_9FUNG|nr:hypothetical protein BGZ65_006029 [Modicella reniformis]
MPRVNTRSTSSKNRHDHHRGYKDDPEDTHDDDDFYGMRELKHQLAGLNLQLKDTRADGNCLFRACADQYYGNERDHVALRAEICQYIDDHNDHFMAFLDNETVEAHLAKMRKNATYGGNIELVAFARLKRVDIKVYQPGYIYVIEGVDVKKEGSNLGLRPVMHIAYHSWEHYSSIRNIDGPHEGLPEITPREIQQKPLLTNQDPPRSLEREVMKVSGVYDLELIRKLFEKYRGDVGSVYNDLAEKAFADANQSDHEEEEEEEEEEEKKEQGTSDTVPKVTTPEDNEIKEIPSSSSSSSSSSSPSSSDMKAHTESHNDSPDDGNKDTPSLLDDENEQGEARPASPSIKMPADEPPPKGIIPKKRISSREKKELARRNQKLNRKNKGKQDIREGGESEKSWTDPPKHTLEIKPLRTLFV